VLLQLLLLWTKLKTVLSWALALQRIPCGIEREHTIILSTTQTSLATKRIMFWQPRVKVSYSLWLSTTWATVISLTWAQTLPVLLALSQLIQRISQMSSLLQWFMNLWSSLWKHLRFQERSWNLQSASSCLLFISLCQSSWLFYVAGKAIVEARKSRKWLSESKGKLTKHRPKKKNHLTTR